MINKFFTSLIITLMLASQAYSAGSSDSGSSKTKTQYDMALTHIKAAKKLEKKGKTMKANQKYEKAQKLLLKSNEKEPDNPDRHKQQSMILVDKDTPGIKIKRHLPAFGFDDAPHGHAEVEFKDVKVPPENMLLGEGRGFEIAQGRLGPGRIHHCMRTIGLAEVALEAMCKRLMSRKAFGKEVVRHSVWQERIADARINIEMTRLLTLKAATMMDEVGNKVAKNEIAMIKVAAPNMALKIIDDAIQAFGGAGVTTDPHLAQAYAGMRTLRLADGPDEVHRLSIARNELKKYL